MKKTEQKNVRAIDVGYGQTKYTHSIGADNKPVIKHFPSIVRKIETQDDTLFLVTGSHKRNAVRLEISGQTFEVGPDAEDPLHNTAILSEDFSKTNEHKALLLGALYFMEPVSKIDLLVLGLPVRFLAKKKAGLEKKFQGKHTLPDGRVVCVERVEVIAQPIGGYLSWKETLPSNTSPSSTLVIDPGFYTFDFVVVKNGSAVASQCGSFPGGMSMLLQFVAKQIGKKFDIEYTNLRRIERGIISGNFSLYGKKVDLRSLMKPFQKETFHIIQKIVNQLDDGRDIDAIVLVGGGAGMFSGAIRLLFPKHALIAQKDAIGANASGFWLYGRDVADADKTRGAA
jgi:plasmid segregation protein ParM